MSHKHATRQQVIQQYSRGLSVRTVAYALGLNYGTVHYWLYQAGVLRTRQEGQDLLKEQRRG